MEKRKRGWKYHLINLIAFVIFFGSAGVYFYPVFSNMWNRYRSNQLLVHYQDVIEEFNEEEFEQIWAEARAYNAQHTVNSIVDAFDEVTEEYVLTHPYDTLLNPAGDEIMGSLEIPCIDVFLAIYHGIGPDALNHGCGHIEGTSLPVGGENTHAVLSAHRGLPSALLFTDLDQVKEGDLFYLHILNEVLAYEVDQIVTVLPTEMDALAIEEGKDLVTLVTCTPYAVNTHRLLVRGHRVPYAAEESENKNLLETVIPEKDRTLVLTLLTGMICLVTALLIWIIAAIHKHRKHQTQQKELEE